MSLLMLDLFAGLGGASRAMRERGWRVVTVDNDVRFAPEVLIDVGRWRWTGERPDLVWASPPCDEFAREFMPWSRTGKSPDLWLVNAARRIAIESGARHWIIENVKGAQRYLGRAQWIRNPIYLWGEFPPIHHGPIHAWKERLSSTRAAERAVIPYSLSLAVAESIEQALAFQASECPALSHSHPTPGPVGR